MLRRILIDAAHVEEVRLVMTTDGRVSELDYKNETKKNIKGNVYLAKVSRVEPSLQAAFVDYGPEKHGFLPLSEIHPDYYQLPKADKEALMAMMHQEKSEGMQGEDGPDEGREDRGMDSARFYKKYKIQEILKREQVILVQVAKEERGNKGASLTTYLSLAGRFCVLMPNAYKGGGVSRKIEDVEERDRLKDLIHELTQDDDRASVIVRTAGAHKTKVEIKRDFSSLKRLWDNIRKYTLSSVAPAFIHEEGDIIKKAIRDMYDSDVEEIIVSGHKAFQNAKDFMKLLLPKHIDKVKEYTDQLPIFSEYGIDEQIAKLYDNEVPLKSGGAIVINQTEALVAIDVNSGKLTSETSLESTALKSNLEAATEIAKQLRLRDLSGLIVVDFIDMMDSHNRKLVRKALKDALANDRARVQMGKIGEFGLLEMSRQRLRPSFAEAHLVKCEHCRGTGRVRPLVLTAVALFKAIEREAAYLTGEVRVSGSKELVLYVLNTFKAKVFEIERTSSVTIHFDIDETAGTDGFFLETRKGIESPLHSATALSSIDNEFYPEEKDEISEEEPKAEKKRGSNTKGEYKEERKRFSNTRREPQAEKKHISHAKEDEFHEPAPFREGDDVDPIQGSHRRKINKKRSDHRPRDHHDVKDRRPADPNVTEENSSFLKEIWKKIMD